MHLIVGLGNPGTQYERTRHNAGFLALDALVRRVDPSLTWRSQFHGLTADLRINGQRCLLLKPTTFMNRSGLAVGAAATFHKVERHAILIVVDDLALPLGRIRLRAEGGAGGHNGLKSVEQSLGSQAYARLRIGIDAARPGDQVDHVLGVFGPGEWEQVAPSLETACEAMICWMSQGIEAAMTRYNGP